MRIKKSLIEAKFIANSEDALKMADKMGKEDIVKIVDEAGDVNAPKKSLNNPKIEKFVNELNQLIQSAVDSDGDPIAVVDTSGTWEEPYVYLPIEYVNGKLKITSKSQYKNEPEVDVISRQNMEYDGVPTLRLIKRLYTAAIKKQSKPQMPVQENDTVNLLPLKKLYNIAKKAGNIVMDAEDELLNLYSIYIEREGVPKDKVINILNKYDIKVSDLKGPKPKFRPNPEFAHLFNSSVTEDGHDVASRGIEYGQSEAELGDADWEELYKVMSQDGKITDTENEQV